MVAGTESEVKELPFPFPYWFWGFVSKTFDFEIILGLKKSCRDDTEFPCSLYQFLEIA